MKKIDKRFYRLFIASEIIIISRIFDNYYSIITIISALGIFIIIIIYSDNDYKIFES